MAICHYHVPRYFTLRALFSAATHQVGRTWGATPLNEVVFEDIQQRLPLVFFKDPDGIMVEVDTDSGRGITIHYLGPHPIRVRDNSVSTV